MSEIKRDFPHPFRTGSQFESLASDQAQQLQVIGLNVRLILALGVLAMLLLPALFNIADQKLSSSPPLEEIQSRLEDRKARQLQIIRNLPPLIWHKIPQLGRGLSDPVCTAAQTCVMTSVFGDLLFSEDQGKSWRAIPTDITTPLNAPVFSEQGTGIITGAFGTLLVSTDDGRTWQPSSYQTHHYLAQPVFTEQGVGLITSKGKLTGQQASLLVSTDGGHHWLAQSIDQASYLNTPAVFDDTIIITGDQGTIMVSENGGSSWHRVADLSPLQLEMPVISSQGVIVISGDTGTLIISDNGGKNWQLIQTGLTGPLSPAVFSQSGTGVVLSASGFSEEHRQILVSSNGGKSWLPRSLPESGRAVFHHAAFASANNIVLTGSGPLLVSTDGGRQWDSAYTAPGLHLHKAIFPTPDTGVISGDQGVLLVSVDEGETWRLQDTVGKELLAPAWFADAENGFITTASGGLYISSDGGKTWRHQALTGQDTINRPVFSARNTGVISGGSGQLYVSPSGSDNWRSHPVPDRGDLSPPLYTDDGLGLMTSASGSLLYSTDGGEHWQEHSLGTVYSLSPPHVNRFGIAMIKAASGDVYTSLDIAAYQQQEQLSTELLTLLEQSTAQPVARQLVALNEQITALTGLLNIHRDQLAAERQKGQSATIIRVVCAGIAVLLILLQASHYRRVHQLMLFYRAQSMAFRVNEELFREGVSVDEFTRIIRSLTPPAEQQHRKPTVR